MIYTIEEIKHIDIPIVSEYGIAKLSMFGSYARGEANENSDLDFIMGEFVSRLSDEFINEHSEIPWEDIKKMRNVHAHNYDNVMFDTLWVTMKRDVPELREYLQNLI